MPCNDGYITQLERLRTEQNMSREELSKCSGVKASTIKKYEVRASDISHAAYVTVVALANALGVDPDELIEPHFL